MSTTSSPEYLPGARVLVGAASPGEVRRAIELDGEWTYYVALDSGGAVTCTGAILTLGTLPAE